MVFKTPAMRVRVQKRDDLIASAAHGASFEHHP
jgi:hypothetical protein